jgi:nucleotide-binding universal stress UspA family protein
MKSEFLIVTNGFKGTWSAIEYGAALAQSMQMKTTLLGVTEELNPAAIDDHHPLEDIFAQAVDLFQKLGVEYTLDIRNGIAEKVIPEIANKGNFITVVSPLGRPQFKRWLTGRSIRSLMEQVQNPILYVPEARLPLKNILITLGGLGYGEAAENFAVQLARANKAELTILYVIPPADLDYPSARNVQNHVNDLINTDTLPGRSLRRALDFAQNAGLSAKSTARQGNIVDEILAEIREGDYDLVCMGSAYSGHTLRQYYSPNVTAEVAASAHCPILTTRHKASV